VLADRFGEIAKMRNNTIFSNKPVLLLWRISLYESIVIPTPLAKCVIIPKTCKQSQCHLIIFPGGVRFPCNGNPPKPLTFYYLMSCIFGADQKTTTLFRTLESPQTPANDEIYTINPKSPVFSRYQPGVHAYTSLFEFLTECQNRYSDFGQNITLHGKKTK
jgi:hypothetical protein